MSGEENNNDPNSIANKPPVPPRHDLVKTAAQFLSASNVQKSPQDMKIAFLKRKGLSDAEIELAFKECEVIIQNRAMKKHFLLGLLGSPKTFPPNQQPLEICMLSLQLDQQNKFYPIHQSSILYPPTWPLQSRWLKLRDITNSIALLAGLAYAIYWFYKKYIVPYLWGRRDKKSTDTRLGEVEKSVSALGRSMEVVKEGVEGRGALGRQIGEVKSEIASLKKLLLSRKQFPSVSSAPISIPSWQIAASEGEEKEEEGTGTNGSDSSLEMIKE